MEVAENGVVRMDKAARQRKTAKDAIRSDQVTSDQKLTQLPTYLLS